MSVVEVVDRILRADVTMCDRAGVEGVLRDTTVVQSWLDLVKIAAAIRLRQLNASDPAVSPEDVAAGATRGSRRDTDNIFRRADTIEKVPELGEALGDSQISTAHLDVVARALASLEPEDRALLADEGAWLAAVAARSTPDEFARAVRSRINRIRTDNGIARFERQRRATRLRSWTDRDTGMICIRGEFDPESGAALLGRIESALETLFHDTVPDTCPSDPQAKQDHLRALALLALSEGRGAGGRPEISIVIDHDTLVHGFHRNSHVDCGHAGIDLPVDTIRRLGCLADIVPVIVDSNGVVLTLGRSQRLANRSQRRALRAMYSTCAIPGCCVRFDHCVPHHIDWWRHGGPTDLCNLLPVCSRHHHLVHEGGWKLALDPTDRGLTITLPDGTAMSTGPPGSHAA